MANPPPLIKMALGSAQKQQSNEISQLVDKQTKEITIKKAEVMKDQERVEPAVIDAQNAVKPMKKQHQEEERSMANPPPLIKMALECLQPAG